MITKNEAFEIMKEYLEKRNRQPSSIDALDKVHLVENDEVLHGHYKGQYRPVYWGGYGKLWGLEERSMFVCIDAETGKVLYSISPHGCIENLLEEEFE